MNTLLCCGLSCKSVNVAGIRTPGEGVRVGADASFSTGDLPPGGDPCRAISNCYRAAYRRAITTVTGDGFDLGGESAGRSVAGGLAADR